MDESILQNREKQDDSWRHISWWFIAIIILFLVIIYLLIAEPAFYSAFKYIRNGIPTALYITVMAFLLALAIGLPVGMSCKSQNLLLRNIALFYVALVGSVPTLVLLLLMAFVLAPFVYKLIGSQPEQISMINRAILALAIAYSVNLADVIRLSSPFESEGRFSLFWLNGRPRPLRHILRSTSPTTIRKTILAGGIVFIALLKDSSLASVLAILDITERSRIYIGSTLRFQEALFAALFLYLIMTVPLRLLLQRYEQGSSRASFAGRPLATAASLRKQQSPNRPRPHRER